MNFKIFEKLVISFFIIFTSLSFSTAAFSGGQFKSQWNDNASGRFLAKQNKSGPPPHAPAQGYRAKYQYRYYPDSSVYYDAGRKLYFYLKGDHWEVTASLPVGFQINLDAHVSIEMDSDRPYLYYHEHKQKYPPGQIKQKKPYKRAKKNHKK